MQRCYSSASCLSLHRFTQLPVPLSLHWSLSLPISPVVLSRRYSVKPPSPTMLQASKLRQAFSRNGSSLGLWQMLPGANISRVLARTQGIDWVMVDCEHGQMSGRAASSDIKRDGICSCACRCEHARSRSRHRGLRRLSSCPNTRLPILDGQACVLVLGWWYRRRANRPVGALDSGAHGVGPVPHLAVLKESWLKRPCRFSSL